jgi:hypothetical protein
MRPWKLVRIVTGIVIFVAVAGYVAFEARGIVAGPSLIVIQPTPGTTLTKPVTRLTGNVERISKITLNGRQIFVSEEGVFDEPLILAPGYNEILVEAWDRFDKKTSVMLPVVHTPLN